MKILFNDGHVDVCPKEMEQEVLRHSAAHIMAQAVKRLFPETHFGYGPATDTGFRYDIDTGDRVLGESDFPARVRSAWSWEAEPQGPRLVLVFHVYLFILSFSTQLLSTCCIKRPGYTWVKNTDSVCTSQLACKALGICLCALSLRATSPSPSGEHGLGSDSFRSGRACIKYSV